MEHKFKEPGDNLCLDQKAQTEVKQTLSHKNENE